MLISVACRCSPVHSASAEIAVQQRRPLDIHGIGRRPLVCKFRHRTSVSVPVHALISPSHSFYAAEGAFAPRSLRDEARAAFRGAADKDEQPTGGYLFVTLMRLWKPSRHGRAAPGMSRVSFRGRGAADLGPGKPLPRKAVRFIRAESAGRGDARSAQAQKGLRFEPQPFSMPCRYTRGREKPPRAAGGTAASRPLCPHAECRAFTPRPRRYILPTGISTVTIPEVISGRLRDGFSLRIDRLRGAVGDARPGRSGPPDGRRLRRRGRAKGRFPARTGRRSRRAYASTAPAFSRRSIFCAGSSRSRAPWRAARPGRFGKLCVVTDIHAVFQALDGKDRIRVPRRKKPFVRVL